MYYNFYMKYEIKPILKWAGGKRLVFPEIKKRLPEHYNRYFEPFVGGGYVLFTLQPEEYFINDYNTELINLYKEIMDKPKQLISELKKFSNTKENFYDVREWDRDLVKYNKLSSVKKAARIIFLNKTCYNGLYRVNSEGQLNAPFGNYKNPLICNKELITNISHFFNNTKPHFSTGDFYDVLKNVKKGDFVYLDPPYDPISSSSSFTGYSINGFTREDQIRVKEFCDKVDEKGAYFMLSNSCTKFIKDLWTDSHNYIIDEIMANRSINSKGDKRQKVKEIIVTNYEYKR